MTRKRPPMDYPPMDYPVHLCLNIQYLFNTCTVMEKSKSEKLLDHNYRVTTSLNDVTD